jgi:hypothetical protein
LRTTFLAILIFTQVLGFFLGTYSITRNGTYPNGNSLKELFYPYQLEGAIAMATGIAIFFFGFMYAAPIKGKKDLPN